MPNENKKLMDYQKQVTNNEISALIREDAKTCKDIATNPPARGQMPDYVFAYIYVPFFTKLRELNDPKSKNTDKSEIREELIYKWISVAGNQYSPIDLIDGKGNVVDTVPGLRCQPDLMEKMDNVDFGKIATTYEQKKSRFVKEGESYISGELKSLEDGYVSNEKKSAFKAEWDRVLNKYKLKEKKEDEIKPISKEAEKQVSDAVKSKLNITDSELEYD